MKRLLHLVNEIGLGWLVTMILGTIVAFALGYCACAGAGMLVYNYDADQSLGFLDSLYFSIVTISSLGYGDIHPLGWARLLVGLEVLTGLGFLGVLVAKVSSVKQDYILQRLYAEAEDEKLATYVRDLEEQRSVFRTTAQLLLSGEIDPALTTTFRRDTPGITFFSSYRQLLTEIHDFASYEASNHALFGVVDDSRIESVYDSIRGVLRRMTLLWESDPDLSCELVFCGNAAELEHVCQLARQLADLGRKQSRNAEVVQICNTIVDLVEKVRTEVLPRI